MGLVLGKLAFIGVVDRDPAAGAPGVGGRGGLSSSTSFVLAATLAVVFQLAHCLEEAEFSSVYANGRGGAAPSGRATEWRRRWTSRRAAACWPGTWGSGLNFQVEHHLFSRVCHIHYPELSKIVAAACADHDIRYLSHDTVWSAIASHAPGRAGWDRPPTTATRGVAGARTCASAHGAPSARTTAPTARPGTTSPTTTPAPGPTAGARTASPASATTGSGSASRWRCWNGRDPILKERVFGLTSAEGNHGEDAKEYWWYLDATPTHSWMRWRYHYPQARVPLRATWSSREPPTRTGDDPEYELVDTGVFDDDRYWVVDVDYAKADARRPVHAHPGPQRRARRRPRSTCCPTLWFRNTWSWGAWRRPHARRAQRRRRRRS